jgi:hypothetical protein
MGASTTLAKAGMRRDTLRQGDTVTVTAFPAKNGSPRGSARRITWADGRSLDVADTWAMAEPKQ